MFRIITKNFFVKLACLIIATGMWLYVSSTQSTVGKFPSSIKIKSVNAASGLVATYDTKTLTIKIMAEPNVWKTLTADSFSASVDLVGKSAGTYELSVDVTSSVPNVEIVDKSPQKILVSLEPIISKEVNINKKIEGSAGEGLVAGNVAFTPDKVTVKGAKSLVENITEAMADVMLNGETADFTRNLSLYALDDKGEAIKDIEFSPSETAAKISIVKASNNKTVGIKVVTSGSPKSGYYVSSVSSTPTVVDVTGPLTILSDLNYIETVSIDLNNLDKDVEKTVGLNLPSGIVLQTGSPSQAKVKLSISENVISREMVTTFSFDNLDSAYKVSGLNPTQVKTLVSGPANKVNILSALDVVYGVDLAGKGSGVYNFDLNSKNYRVPDGIQIVSSLPSTISVSVDKK